MQSAAGVITTTEASILLGMVQKVHEQLNPSPHDSLSKIANFAKESFEAAVGESQSSDPRDYESNHKLDQMSATIFEMKQELTLKGVSESKIDDLQEKLQSASSRSEKTLILAQFMYELSQNQNFNKNEHQQINKTLEHLFGLGIYDAGHGESSPGQTRDLMGLLAKADVLSYEEAADTVGSKDGSTTNLRFTKGTSIHTAMKTLYEEQGDLLLIADRLGHNEFIQLITKTNIEISKNAIKSMAERHHHC